MSGSDEWRTPPAYFRERWERFHFTVDAAASMSNTLVQECGGECDDGGWCRAANHAVGRFYTVEDSGLEAAHYVEGDRVFCNPPYSNPGPWVELAATLAKERGVLWDMLLPPGVDTRWFARFIWNHRAQRFRDGVEGRFYDGRLHFVGEPGKDSPRQGNLIVTFLPGADA